MGCGRSSLLRPDVAKETASKMLARFVEPVAPAFKVFYFDRNCRNVFVLARIWKFAQALRRCSRLASCIDAVRAGNLPVCCTQES